METAVFNAVDEVLERSNRVQRIKTVGEYSSSAFEAPPNVAKAPEGLGGAIDAIVRQQKMKHEEAENPLAPSSQNGGVVVNVGGGTANGSGSHAIAGDIIEHLASFVVSGQEFEQSHRLRTAVSVLSGAGTTDEERKTLAARLDEAIAAKKKTRSSSIATTARMAWNKLSTLISE